MKYMLNFIFICLALSVPVVHAQSPGELQDQPFHISSRDSPFGVQAEFEGTYRVTESSVEVYVSKGSIYVSEHCPYQGRRRINYIKFGLGNRTDSSWRVENSDSPFYLSAIMSPREEYPLSGLRFSLPKERNLDLANRWLVVEIQDYSLDLATDEQRTGYAFVHSCSDIFINRGNDVALQNKPCKSRGPQISTKSTSPQP